MPAVMMPGGPVADAVFADLAPRIAKLIEGGHTPGLATVLIGDDEPSARYVGMKMQKAEELGCNSPHVHLPADCTTEQAIDAVQALNADPAVDAMLVQYPGPPQVDFDAVLLAVDPGQGRRRDAPHQRRSPGARHPRARWRAPRPASKRCSRTTTCRWRAATS